MPGRKKSEWSVKRDALKANLPVGFDARVFKGCRVHGSLNKDGVAGVCEAKGWKDKASDIIAFLEHGSSKPRAVRRKQSPRKQSPRKQETGASTDQDLLAKKTYAGLSVSDIGKVVEMLTSIVEDRKEQEIAAIKARIENDQRILKDLQSK